MNNFLEGEIVLAFIDEALPGLKKGQPALFLETTSQAVLLEAPTAFLSSQYVANGKTPSPRTWAGAAQALKTWLQYLQANGKHWRDAMRDDRIGYRDAYSIGISPRTQEKYENGTIAGRMSVIQHYHKWGRKNGEYYGDIAEEDEDKDLPKVRPNVVVRPLPTVDLKTLIHHAGPQAALRNGDNRLSRNRLIFDFGWAVGLRVTEIAGLTTLQFLSLSVDPDALYVDHSIEIIRKGGAKKIVAVPTWLILDVMAYIDGERSDVLRAAGITGRNASNRLFLCNMGHGRQGKPLSSNGMQVAIRDACISLGFVDYVELTDPDTGGKSIGKRAKYSMHDLRHTYAVLTYHVLLASGEKEPWKKIQVQLGHTNPDVTRDIYLAHVELFSMRPGVLNVRQMIGL